MAFGFKKRKHGGGDEPMTVADTSGQPAVGESGKALVGRMKTLGIVFVALLVAISTLVYMDNRDSANGTAYISAAGEMRMLSQRLAKATSLAVQGNEGAFTQLKESRQTFGDLLERLTKGGDIAGREVPPSEEDVRPQIEALTKLWEPTCSASARVWPTSMPRIP
jgi:twitching motility protein PilJ